MKTIKLETSVSNAADARALIVELNIPENQEELVSRMGDTATAIDFFTRGLKIAAQGGIRAQLKKDVSDKDILKTWTPDFVPPVRKPADKVSKIKKLAAGMTKEELLAALEIAE